MLVPRPLRPHRTDAPIRPWRILVQGDLRHSSGLLIGLTQHARNDSKPFAEWFTGFDHIALCVADTDELCAWESRLKAMGIEASEIKTTPLGSLITVRDPDNIQIELYAPKP